ncbi:MAG: Sec-independent protein translocase protein TatB [Luteimonas sp.]
MFEVGFSELMVIAVVALLVLGPERLPKAARFAGLWVRRARAQWNSVKAEFERDIADDELKRTLRETQASLRDAHASLRDAGNQMQREFHDAREALRGDELMRGPQPPGLPSPEAASPASEALFAIERAQRSKLLAPPPPSVPDDVDPER